MAWYPKARKRPMPYNGELPKRQHAPVAIMHTNGGGTDKGSLFGWFSRKGNTVCSHFQIMNNGTAEQYVDTDRQAYAQHAGNPYAVSFEFEDDNDPSRPMTDAQIQTAVDILVWLKVPAKLASDNANGGVGWHSKYADWNTSHHNCPGTVRVAQIRNHLIPRLAAAYGDDDVTKDEVKAAVREVLNEELVAAPAETGEKAGTKRSVLTALTQVWGHLLRTQKTVDDAVAARKP